VSARTFVIGDIHGDLAALTRLMNRLPERTADDTLVFLGDYVDRGPDSRGVVERLRSYCRKATHKTVTLRGNHEDKWVRSYAQPDVPYLVQVGNGCGATYRSYTGGAPLLDEQSLEMSELPRMLDVRSWLPADVAAWMDALDLWYEDEHAIYVHAGLESEGEGWKHPRDSSDRPLLWMREPSFYASYRGKRVCFGHTPVNELPLPPGDADPTDVWMRGDLVAIDTGSGKGGFLSAVELPSLAVYDSR
jgi:serine/threonine protein phosphatase 1